MDKSVHFHIDNESTAQNVLLINPNTGHQTGVLEPGVNNTSQMTKGASQEEVTQAGVSSGFTQQLNVMGGVAAGLTHSLNLDSGVVGD